MDGNLDHLEIFEKMDEKVYPGEEITDLEIEVKIEKLDETANIKSEVCEETNNSEPLQIIGEKRKNQETSNLEDETKKLKKNLLYSKK